MIFEQISHKNRVCQLRMTGSIGNVISAAITEDNAVPRIPAMTGYSFGLGAFAPNYSAVEYSLGEFCCTPSFQGYLSAGEQNLPWSQRGNSIRFYTPFNVSLGFDFNEVYYFNSETAVTFSGLYDLFLQRARNNPAFKGLLGVSGIFQIESFFGSLIITAPLQGTLAEGKLTDPGRFHQWFRIDTNPVYVGYRAVSVGLGLDLANNTFPESKLNRIFYLHPGNRPASDKMLHNHCFILPPGNLPEKISNYHSAVDGLLSSNQIVDVKHILDNSTVKSGFFAISYLQDIVDL